MNVVRHLRRQQQAISELSIAEAAARPLIVQATVIDLNGRAMIEVKRGPYLVGTYANAGEMVTDLKRRGIDPANVVLADDPT